jgi:hypothetical protein
MPKGVRLLGALLIVMLLVPPYRTTGTWISSSDLDSRASGLLQVQLDRRCFGWIPEYHLVGPRMHIFREDQLTLSTPQGSYMLLETDMTVDWVILGAELWVLFAMGLGYWLFNQSRHRRSVRTTE